MALFPPFRLKIEKCAWADELEKAGLSSLPEPFRTQQRAAFIAKPQNRFLVVSFALKNKGESPVMWTTQHPLVFQLKNASGKQYVPVSQLVNMDDLSGKLILGSDNINPDMSLSGSEVFDVPKDDYTLVVSTGQWAGGWSFATGSTAFYWLLSPSDEK